MIALHRIAIGVLWALAAVGIACGIVWGATAAGLIKPLIVISGSMEPNIMTGDLVVDTPVDTGSLAVGEVVSLPSAQTHDLVTHRIQSIVRDGDGYTIVLKGDNNRFVDAVGYHVGERVWAPSLRLPGAGAVVQRMTAPPVALALLLGVAALVGLAWITPATRREEGEVDASADAAETPLDDTLPVGSRRERRAPTGATAS